MDIASDADLNTLVQAARDGQIPKTHLPQVADAIQRYEATRAERVKAQEQQQAAFDQHDPDRPWYRHGNPDVREVGELSAGDWGMGIYELGMMSLTGTLAQPVSGIAGLAAAGTSKLFGSDKAMENAAAVQKWVEGVITNDPEGEAMQTFGAMVGPTAEMLARKVDDGIFAAADGNAEIATGLKTLLYGVPSVVGLGRMKIPTRLKTDIEVHQTKKRVAAETEAEGYTLDSEMLPGKVKQKAHELVPDDSKAAGWDQIIDEVRAAERVSRDAIEDAYDAARATDAFMDIKPLRFMAKDIKKEFEAKYNTKRMPQLQDHITDLRRLASTVSNTGQKLPKGKRRTNVDYNEIELLRQRISNDISGQPGKGNFTPQDKALMALRDRLDTTVDELWRRGAVSGDPDAVQLWQSARGLARGHAQRFKADENIRKMLLEDATPEGVYRLVIGSSAMGAKPQAVKTIRRFKDILGEDHPALVNVRKAMIRDLLMPALGDKANFGALGINIDNLLKNHYSLVEAAGIDVAQLRKLRRAAHVANETVRLSPEKFGAEYVNSVVASVAFGHGIARKGAFVRTVRKLLNRSMGVGLMSKAEIKRHLLDAEYDRPIRDYSGPELATWLAMTSSADVSNVGIESQEETE